VTVRHGQPHDWPLEPWALVETGFDLAALPRSESLFAQANGHIGLRGNLDEGEPRGLSGTYLNGFYESYPLEYGERGFGFAEDGQTVVSVPEGKLLRVLVENEPLDLERGTVEHHERRLDLRTGLLERDLVWRSAYGQAVRVRSRRLVSFVQRSVVAIEFTVEALEEPLRIGVQSLLIANESASASHTDPRVGKLLDRPLEPQLHVGRDLRAVLAHRTRRTDIRMAAGQDHVMRATGDGTLHTACDVEEDLARMMVSVRLEPGEPLTIEKYVAYHWSSRQTVHWLRDQVDASLESAIAEGFDGLAERQRAYLDDFWDRADVVVEGDLELQQAVRFAMFGLLQAGARVEGRAIGAKGLTGTGYDGHAFWDTETFVLPVLTYVEPRIVRDALLWRWRTLGLARDRAALFGLAGASFPWRTIHGEECSAYWPAGVAAAHVNADVADAVRRYVAASGDEVFARGEGLEILVETARFWCSLGYHDRHGQFRIDGVTGPDEYSALVDNNVYTNLMAQRNLVAAADAVERFPEEAAALGVDAQEEVPAWRHAAQEMYVPYDHELQVHPQDQDFLAHEVWDFEGTPADRYPLLLHFPYFHLYRKQVCKQADLVLALHLRGDHFTDEEKRRNFDHYEAVTVRDSSLSASTQAVVAAEVGHLDLAYSYLREAALTDLDDLHSNAANGLHMAALAGGVLGVVAGLGGFRDHDGRWSFRPRLAGPLTRVRFSLKIRDSLLRVCIDGDGATYRVSSGPPLTLSHWDEELEVGEDPVRRDLPEPPGELEPPRQPFGREPARHCPPAPLAQGGGEDDESSPTSAPAV
jgi:alpha,alpha-trehalose phosphorylase